MTIIHKNTKKGRCLQGEMKYLVEYVWLISPCTVNKESWPPSKFYSAKFIEGHHDKAKSHEVRK